jgi:hypothetical protein
MPPTGSSRRCTLETVAVLTTMLSPVLGPPFGQDYLYEVVALTGHALCAVT